MFMATITKKKDGKHNTLYRVLSNIIETEQNIDIGLALNGQYFYYWMINKTSHLCIGAFHCPGMFHEVSFQIQMHIFSLYFYCMYYELHAFIHMTPMLQLVLRCNGHITSVRWMKVKLKKKDWLVLSSFLKWEVLLHGEVHGKSIVDPTVDS